MTTVNDNSTATIRGNVVESIKTGIGKDLVKARKRMNPPWRFGKRLTGTVKFVMPVGSDTLPQDLRQCSVYRSQVERLDDKMLVRTMQPIPDEMIVQATCPVLDDILGSLSTEDEKLRVIDIIKCRKYADDIWYLCYSIEFRS